MSSWLGTKFLNYAKGKNKEILPDFFKNIIIYFFILLFSISIGAEARTGGHIRQLIHGWNKNRLKQNKNETQSDLMLATLFQNDENITEEEQQTAAGGFEPSEEDFDSYYEEQNAYLEPEVKVTSGFGQVDNNGGGGDDIYYNENQEQEQIEKPKKIRKKRTQYKPVEEPKRVEILKYVLSNKKSLYPEGQKSGGRLTNVAMQAWDKVYELCIR